MRDAHPNHCQIFKQEKRRLSRRRDPKSNISLIHWPPWQGHRENDLDFSQKGIERDVNVRYKSVDFTVRANFPCELWFPGNGTSSSLVPSVKRDKFCFPIYRKAERICAQLTKLNARSAITPAATRVKRSSVINILLPAIPNQFTALLSLLCLRFCANAECCD